MKSFKESAIFNAKSGIIVTFLPEQQDVSVSQKDSCLLDVALRAGIDIDHTCGGNGTCGTCVVKIVQGIEKLKDREELEQEFANERGLSVDERLACQTIPVEGLIVSRNPKV